MLAYCVTAIDDGQHLKPEKPQVIEYSVLKQIWDDIFTF